MLRVYYDYQIMLAQKLGGISRYFAELAGRLPALGADVKLECLGNRNYYFRDKLGLYDYGKMKLGLLWYANMFKAKRAAKSGKYDIFHATYYHVPYKAEGRLITTIHDMTPEKYADEYPILSRRLIASKKRALREADRIIAVSNNTKQDLLSLCPGLDPAKISVIYHGFSMTRPDGRFAKMAGRPYVLFVGDRRAYKNFPRFVEAAKAVMSRERELEVFCAGGGAFTAEELSLMGEFSPRFHQGFLSDEELAQAYADALCFVFPSQYEGFGIPILEAFACGCPAACSAASAFPEVAGDAAEYFDPLDADDLAGCIAKIIADEALRENLRLKGSERVKLFSWERCARETLKFYEEAVSDD